MRTTIFSLVPFPRGLQRAFIYSPTCNGLNGRCPRFVFKIPRNSLTDVLYVNKRNKPSNIVNKQLYKALLNLMRSKATISNKLNQICVITVLLITNCYSLMDRAHFLTKITVCLFLYVITCYNFFRIHLYTFKKCLIR